MGNSKKNVLTGMRPTGAIHLGHYIGVISNMVALQNAGKYNCFFFLADWHALTSCYDDLPIISKSRRDYVRAWIASGVDPEKSTIYNQSSIPEVLYLEKFFLTLTPPGWADRSPSWKDLCLRREGLTTSVDKLDNLGFYTYPILQAADIAIVNGELVPVGEDQVTHLEIAREIVRKCNRFYKTEIPEPQPLLTPTSKLPGLDGRKMSSSYGNSIALGESGKKLQKQVNKIKSDDRRASIEVAGNPDNCSVFDYHKAFSGESFVQETRALCTSAKLGCGECKLRLGSKMSELFDPIAERMAEISDRDCDDILNEGNKKAQKVISENWQKLSLRLGF